MVGYGLYLSLDGGNAVWSAPPGSSYAAALLSGWLGGTLAGGGKLPGLPLPQAARWTPVPTANGLALAFNGVPLPGSELQGPRLLLDRAMGAVPISFQPGGGPTLQLTGPAPARPGLSLLYADDGNGPLPGVDPCVPCRGNGRQADGPQGLEGPATVVVDLSSSGALPSQMKLKAVWLRVADAFYAFDLSYDSGLLAAVAAGGLDSVVLSGVGGLFPIDQQPSLALVIDVGGLSYWHEIPIQLQR